MNELIVEMEMPTRCIDCGVRLKCKRYVYGLYQDIAEDLKPLMGDKDCLIKGELSEEHGDLIDADAVYERAGQKKGEADPLALAREFWSAPVIIAAERKDDGKEN